MEASKNEDAVNENNTPAPDRPALPARTAAKPNPSQDGSELPKKAPPLPVRPPNASSSKGGKPVPPNKPAIAAKPKPSTPPKPVPGRKPVGVKVLPVPTTRPKPSTVQNSENKIGNGNKNDDAGAKEEVGSSTQVDNKADAPKPRGPIGIRVLPVPPKKPIENIDTNVEKSEQTFEPPKVQPRPSPRPRPVPQKRKSIAKKELESIDLTKDPELSYFGTVEPTRESIKLDGVTRTASSDSSNVPIFGQTDDDKVKVREKTAENGEATSAKRRSSFVPTRKAPPPPVKPKVPKPKVTLSEGTNSECSNSIARNEDSLYDNNMNNVQNSSQTVTDAKSSTSTVKIKSASSFRESESRSVNDDNEDSPMRPPRPNRVKKRLSCASLLDDNKYNDVAQVIDSESSQKNGNDETFEKIKEDNAQGPGKLKIKELASNLNVSAVKGLKHQIDTKDKPRPLLKAKTQDEDDDSSSTNREASDAGDSNAAMKPNLIEQDDALQKELSEKAATTKVENERKNLFSFVGMGAQDVFSHSFSSSNNDLRKSTPSKTGLVRSRSNEHMSAGQNKRLSRSHTVECLFDENAENEDIYEVIPDSPGHSTTSTPTSSQNFRTSRRISRSSSMGQLLDLPPRDIVTSRLGKPVFVPPPPPPYSPPNSASPRFKHFVQPFLSEKAFQTSTASDHRNPHSSRRRSNEAAHDAHQPFGDIPDEDDNVYADTEDIEKLCEPAPKESPPALPRKESVRQPNSNKLSFMSSRPKTTPKRVPSREAPPPPMLRPATGRQVSKSSIPSMEAPSPPVDQLIPAPDDDSNVYDDDGYLAPTRTQVVTDNDYSYADMPEGSSSPLNTEPDILRHESTSRDARQSVTSTDSHIYESIGSKTNSGTAEMKEAANRESARSSRGSKKNRESNMSNVSRSVFYLEVDEKEKSKLERESSRTDGSKTNESFDEIDDGDYHVPMELESYMGPEKTDVGLDIEVPLPPRPPPRKKKPAKGGNKQQEDDDSEDDYIYPGDPEEDLNANKAEDSKKGSDDEGYHYPADMNTIVEPESPTAPPMLPPRQKPNAASTPEKPTDTRPETPARNPRAPSPQRRTPKARSAETVKSPAPPPRSTSKSQSFSTADKVSSKVSRSSSSVSGSVVGLSHKIPAIPPRQYDLAEEEGDYVVPPDPEENTADIKPSMSTSASFPVVLRSSERKKKSRRSSQGGDSDGRPTSWASSDGISSSASYSSGVPSSLHSPLSVSRTSNDSGSSYAHTGSSDDDSDIGDNDKVNNNETLEDSPKARKKLFYIAQEIMTSEKSFVDVLKLLNYDFRAVVDNANQEQQTVPPQLFNQILKFLPQLHKFNKELLKDLKKRVDTWEKNPHIGDIFVTKGPFLKLYTSYIREFEQMTMSLDDARRKYPEFEKVCTDFERSERCRGLALKHFMLKPIQRIPQYRLLLQDYERHLPIGSPDIQDTKMALVIVSEVAEHANQSMKYGDNFKKLWEIQHSLIGHFEVIKPGRTFIKEGILKKLSRKEMQPRMFYLLSDILLYTTPVSGGFRLNQAIPLAGTKVSLPNKEDFKNEFSILSTQRSFTISASTPEERDDWLAQLRNAIEENAKRRQSFDVRALQRTMSVNVNIAVDKDFKLGYRAPVWVPDARVSMCMLCTAEFTVTFRRHHCRSCGKVVCTFCSDYKAPLRYLEYKAARVCMECYDVLEKEIDDMDEELPPVMAGEKGTLKPIATFTKASIKAKFKAIRWSSFRKSKRKRPAVLQEVSANADDADMSGYLKIWKGGKWKKLWFVLKGKALFTYKASEDTAAFESRVLLGYEVRTFNTWFEGVEPNMVFEIIHQGTQPIIFRTESPNSRDRWISAMQKAMVP